MQFVEITLYVIQKNASAFIGKQCSVHNFISEMLKDVRAT